MRWITVIMLVLFCQQVAMAGESSFTLRKKAAESALGREDTLERVQQEDQKQVELMNQARVRMQLATTKNERRFYELDYYEHSALRLRAWLRGFHGLLTMIDRDIVSARVHGIAVRQASSREGRAEFEGLRHIFIHLAQAGGDHKDVSLISYRGETDLHAMRQKMLALTYMNLLGSLDNGRHRKHLAMLQKARGRFEKELDGYVNEYQRLKAQYRRSNNG